jgi:hypothetical protein
LNATLAESRVVAGTPLAPAITPARQRSLAGAVQARWQRADQDVTIDGGLRGELWASRDKNHPDDEQQITFLAPRLSASLTSRVAAPYHRPSHAKPSQSDSAGEAWGSWPG